MRMVCGRDEMIGADARTNLHAVYTGRDGLCYHSRHADHFRHERGFRAMKKTSLSTIMGLFVALPLAVRAEEGIGTNLTVVVTATPITHEETVSKDGAETVTIGRTQLAALNAQYLDKSTVPASDLEKEKEIL